MTNEQDRGALLSGLTKPKGFLWAAPLILGAGLLIGVSTGGDTFAARDGAAPAVAPTAASAQLGAAGPKAETTDQGVLVNEATKTPIRLAAADTPKPAKGFTAEQRKEIGAIVREYLLKNPKVLEEVSQELTKIREQEKEEQRDRVLISEKSSIFRSPYDFVLGDPNGDITVVEYFDYNCGWCKRALNEVVKLTQGDPKVRVVMKEFPIFGEDSEFAARAALASVAQNKYWEFHTALMKAKRVTKANTFDIAASVGIDVAALEKEMQDPKYEKAIAENGRIAQALGMQGTPGFIIDNRVNYGYLPADGLKQIVADVRKEGCKVC